MRHHNLDALAACIMAAVFCVAAFIGLPQPLMATLGIVLFGATGYVWAEALLDERIGGLERVAIAAGLTMIIPVLGGLALYAVGVPLSRPSWIGLMAAAVLSGSAVLILRRRRHALPSSSGYLNVSGSVIRTVAVFGVAALIAAGAVVVAREGAARQDYGGFTQLWVAHDGTAHDLVGITNRVGSTVAFRLVVHLSGEKISVYDFTLRDGGTWRHAVASSSEARLIADLYRLPELSKPYRFVDTAGSGH